MRILLVHNRYRPQAPSGENSVVDQELAALANRGHRVALFQRHSADIASWSILRRATLPAQVLWSEDSRRSLATELVRFAPDVVHIHNTFPLLTPAVLHACRDAGVPVVATLHNYKLACASGDLYRGGQVCHDCLRGSARPALIHGCYRGSRVATVPVVAAATLHARAWQQLVSAYIFISEAQREILRPLGLPGERCFVKHNFVPAPASNTGPKEPVVAFVGRLDPAKGTSFLIAAWDSFRTRRPNSPLRLVIAGSGPLQDQVTAWAARDPSVSMLGQVSREAVGQVLGGARAVVVPSQWEETFGMVAVEAMAVGTAAIASAHGGLTELIANGQDGALFPATDTEALVDLFAEVEDQPARWDRYGHRARQTYQRRFSATANVDRLLDIYRFAITEPSGNVAENYGIAGVPDASSF
jgi:glycosyltransferase involved in cell wall biosynthesis